jgi:hypothetical protein
MSKIKACRCGATPSQGQAVGQHPLSRMKEGTHQPPPAQGHRLHLLYSSSTEPLAAQLRHASWQGAAACQLTRICCMLAGRCSQAHCKSCRWLTCEAAQPPASGSMFPQAPCKCMPAGRCSHVLQARLCEPLLQSLQLPQQLFNIRLRHHNL